VLSVCFVWVLVCPLLLLGHLWVTRQLIELPLGAYLRALGAGLGPVPFIVAGLQLLAQSSLLAGGGGLRLLLLAVVALTIHWAYLQWVLKVRLGDLIPKRQRSAVPSGSADAVPPGRS
jgi:hypothetical protein